MPSPLNTPVKGAASEKGGSASAAASAAAALVDRVNISSNAAGAGPNAQQSLFKSG
jgi:hypothetical protein